MRKNCFSQLLIGKKSLKTFQKWSKFQMFNIYKIRLYCIRILRLTNMFMYL
jgi:hypothetical protein